MRPFVAPSADLWCERSEREPSPRNSSAANPDSTKRPRHGRRGPATACGVERDWIGHTRTVPRQHARRDPSGATAHRPTEQSSVVVRLALWPLGAGSGRRVGYVGRAHPWRFSYVEPTAEAPDLRHAATHVDVAAERHPAEASVDEVQLVHVSAWRTTMPRLAFAPMRADDGRRATRQSR